jgi:hypothetical protein
MVPEMSKPVLFSLTPFQSPAEISSKVSDLAIPQEGFAIAATVLKTNQRLSISYFLSGDLSSVILPATTGTARRKNCLWEQTCFEFFLKVGTDQSYEAPYWEFNLSPAGDWNVFALSQYRQLTHEEPAITSLPFDVRIGEDGLHLDLSVDLDSLIETTQPLQIGVSAVVLVAPDISEITGTPAPSSQETFWAIAHPGPEADFHHPQSFAITL